MNNNLVKRTIVDYVSSAEKLRELLLKLYDGANDRKLTDEAKEKAAYALNMCTVSVSQIIDYKDLNVLEQEYEAILNNINLEQMPKDEALLHILKQILDVITYFRIEDGEKKIIEKEYQQKVKNAIWSAVPNFGLIVAGGNPLTMAVSLASQIGIGYMNYRRNKEDYRLDKEKQEWRLQRSAIEQFNSLRRELFDTAWRLADTYDFPDEYRLTERQISQYNNILTDKDELRKYERLEFIKNRFKAYPPFWYFIGNAACYIAGNKSLKISESTRKIYRERAKEYFEKYEELSKYNILREDKLISTCALEHIDLLIDEEDGIAKNNEKITKLLDSAIKSAGNSFDVIELCALTYLKLDKKEEAAELLRMLINEDYNTIINAQLLSSIYVFNYCNTNKKAFADERVHILADYELLSERVGKDYLFPIPKNNENMQLIEGNFCSKQKDILKSTFALFLKNLIQKYSIEWNRITSEFELGKEYPETFFLATDVAKNNRRNEIKKIFMYNKESAEYYKDRMANVDYGLNLLNVLNNTYKTIFEFEFFSKNKTLSVTVEKNIKSAIENSKDDINMLQRSMGERKFNIKEYKASQDITLERLMGDSIKTLSNYIDNEIDRLENLNEITSIESDLRTFCIKNEISEVDNTVNDNAVSGPKEMDDKFYPNLLGHEAVVAKKYSDFVKSMTNFVRDKMRSIVVEKGHVDIYYNGDTEFNNYFFDERFNAYGNLKKNSIMVISGGYKEDVDLIFTKDSIVTVINQEVKYKCKYQEIDKEKNSILLYNGYFGKLKYENAYLKMNQFYNLIQEIRRKFISDVSDIETECFDGVIVTPTILNQWFRTRNDSQGENIVCAYALPKKEILEGLGCKLDDELDEQNEILQFYYDKNTNDLLALRLVKFKNINSAFHALLQEKEILKVK